MVRIAIIQLNFIRRRLSENEICGNCQSRLFTAGSAKPLSELVADNRLETRISSIQQPSNWFWEFWEYRGLLYFLMWRDITIRYRQTVFGVAWNFIRPFMTIVVFSFIFGTLAKLPSEGVPYPIIVFAGVLPWQFFSNAISAAGESILGNTHLVSKVFFPRAIIPISSILVGIFDSFVSLLALSVLFVYYRFLPSGNLIFLPVFIALLSLLTVGFGLFFAALNARFRDFRHVLPFLIQFGILATPVGYSSASVPAAYKSVYLLNPLVGIIDGFRWAVCGSPFTSIESLAFSLLFGLVVFLLGVWFFRKIEASFADII